MPRAPVRDHRPLSEAHGTTVVKSTGRAPAPQIAVGPPAKRPPDLRETVPHAFCAHILCKGSVQRYCARMASSTPPEPPRDPPPAPRRGLAQGARPPPALPAAVAGCGSAGRPPPPPWPPPSAPTPAPRPTTCASSSPSGLVTDTGEGEGKRRLWTGRRRDSHFDPSDFAGDEDAETALELARSATTPRHFAEQFERWLDVEASGRRPGATPPGMSDTFIIATPRAGGGAQARDRRAPRPLPPGRPGQPAGQAARRLQRPLPARPRPGAPAACGPTERSQEARPHMTAAHTPLSATTARRVFLLLNVTRWFPVGLVIGVLTLIALQRGMSVAQLGVILSAQGFVVLGLELPTGGFADALGRRPVLLASAVANLVSWGLFMAAHSFWRVLRRHGGPGRLPGARLRATRGAGTSTPRMPTTRPFRSSRPCPRRAPSSASASRPAR